MKALISRLLLIVMVAAGLSGCGAAEPVPAEPEQETQNLRATVTEADPQSAVDEIYATLPEAETTPLSGARFNKLFPELGEVVDEFFGCTSSPNGGLSDVLILRPAEGSGNRDKARDALREYQDSRILEFESYDILNSFEIAKEAVVFDQGDYVVLLMLADNDAAREIIDLYIPL